ncbi:MAG: hypothetical protein M3237_23435, partial [Actinomycetota bacterium]|nr:hypothetical protein [Actinomycetota bacterium]
MRKSRWWVTVAAGALVAALFAPTQAAQGNQAAAAGDPVADPIPEDPTRSSLGLVLEEFHQLPKTDPHPAPTDARLRRHARINYIGEVPDGSGRLYVPDLNGPMYLLDGDERHLLVDLKAEFPDFWSGAGLGSGAGFITFHPKFEDNGKFYTVHTERFGAFTKPTTYPAQQRQGG